MTKSDRLALAEFFTSKTQVLILVMVIWALISDGAPKWMHFWMGLGFFLAGYLVVDITLMEAAALKRARKRAADVDAEIAAIEARTEKTRQETEQIQQEAERFRQETEKLRQQNARLAELEAKLDALWEPNGDKT